MIMTTRLRTSMIAAARVRLRRVSAFLGDQPLRDRRGTLFRSRLVVRVGTLAVAVAFDIHRGARVATGEEITRNGAGSRNVRSSPATDYTLEARRSGIAAHYRGAGSACYLQADSRRVLGILARCVTKSLR